MLRKLLVGLAAAGALVPTAASASLLPPLPIPGSPIPSSAPAYVGAPAVPHATWAPRPPQHPFMADNLGNNIHNDAWMTDTYYATGPLGVDPTTTSTSFVAECASLTFDSQGRIETVCVSVSSITLKLLDPVTLQELASYSLPDRQLSADTFSDFSGGGYFYLDNRDRAVVPTSTNHILVIKQTDAPGFAVAKDFDLTGVVPSGDKIMSNIPDWSGHIVFVTKSGVVGAIDPATGSVETLALDEEIANSLAVDETGGVYVVTTKALYRVDVDAAGRPHVSWRAVYPNGGNVKPGQVSAGSGTTPTVMNGRLVAITDNAEPRMNVVVYRTGKQVSGDREVCRVPIFEAGSSDTENSLIAAGRGLIVTNNYGYEGATKTMNGAVTTPGVARVDVDRDRRGCHTVWSNNEVRSPSAVPKMSLANGLVYIVEKPDTGDFSDAYYLAALDYRTGTLVYEYRYGLGLGYNPNYAPISLGADGAAYVGVLDGLVRIEDATPPDVPDATPRLRLVTSSVDDGSGGPMSPDMGSLRTVKGPNSEWIKKVVWLLGGTDAVDVDRHAPYSHVYGNVHMVAKVVMVDGTVLRLG